jgi:hypothetical protein
LLSALASQGCGGLILSLSLHERKCTALAAENQEQDVS